MDEQKVFKKCDICGEDLDTEAIAENAQRENYTYPVCTRCLNQALKRSEKVLNRPHRRSSQS